MTRTVVTAKPDTSLPELVDEMLRYGISGIPIVDAESLLVGIVTEADLVSKAAYGGRRHRRPLSVLADMWRGRGRRWAAKGTGQTAGQVMTTELETTSPYESVRVAARRMIETGVKRLPVIENGYLVGIVSRTDVLRAMHRNDEELTADLAAVLADPIRVPDYCSVDASVEDGVVTLRGTVQFPMDLPVLDALIWRFPGVVDVRNEATARQPDPTPWDTFRET